MSDTPRTDRVLKNCNGWHHVPIELARELERELNAANQIAKKYEDRYFAALARIKRLEEAGDRMRLYCADTDDCFAWDKAKETKP